METVGSSAVNEMEDIEECDAELDLQKKERGQWSNQTEFFLAMMGYTMGIGSVWRFPIVCSRNGGGAFLIPYFLFLLICGGPLYYMEVCMGQFSGKSAGLAFEFCPLLKGLGLLQVILSVTVGWYAVCILMWTYYYLYSSFFKILPWTTCGNPWNTPFCLEYEATADNGTIPYNTTTHALNLSSSFVGSKDYQSPSFEFWEHKVIGRSSGMYDFGSLQPHLVICLSLAWILTSFAVIKGAKTHGKVVYVTAIAPYLLLTIMFMRGLTLDGAADGIIWYLSPDFTKLFTVQAWLEAGIQVFFSLGPTWGGVITMASYNKFHQKSFWLSTMCVVSSGFASFYNGLVVFTILGFIAKSSGLNIQEVAKQSGPGLTFVVFPIALSKMPLPQLWAVLFFLMLVIVTFDSFFGAFETISSGIIDLCPHHLTSRRVHVNIALTMVFIITGLPFCLNIFINTSYEAPYCVPVFCQGWNSVILNLMMSPIFEALWDTGTILKSGIYLFQLSDWYFAQFGLLFGSLFECIAICWFYGTDRFSHDIFLMTGRDVSKLLRVMWTLFIPLIIFITFVIMLSRYSTPDYGDGYVYSSGSIAFGIFVGLLPVVAVIVVGLNTLHRSQGTFVERLQRCSKPSKDWMPCENAARREYEMKPYSYPRSLKHRILLDIMGTKDNHIM